LLQLISKSFETFQVMRRYRSAWSGFFVYRAYESTQPVRIRRICLSGYLRSGHIYKRIGGQPGHNAIARGMKEREYREGAGNPLKQSSRVPSSAAGTSQNDRRPTDVISN